MCTCMNGKESKYGVVQCVYLYVQVSLERDSVLAALLCLNNLAGVFSETCSIILQ